MSESHTASFSISIKLQAFGVQIIRQSLIEKLNNGLYAAQEKFVVKQIKIFCLTSCKQNSKMKGEKMKSVKKETVKRVLLSIITTFCLLSGSFLWAAENDVKKVPSCIHCGMNRETFAHSRMLIEYNDGSKAGFCSVHCAAVDLALNLDKAPLMISVADYGKKELIDAEKAFWIIGGSKQGVMTKNAKWAFANKIDAERFLADYGGRMAGFDEVLQTTYEDLGNDTKMIREKRKMKKMKTMEMKH